MSEAQRRVECCCAQYDLANEPRAQGYAELLVLTRIETPRPDPIELKSLSVSSFAVMAFALHVCAAHRCYSHPVMLGYTQA